MSYDDNWELSVTMKYVYEYGGSCLVSWLIFVVCMLHFHARLLWSRAWYVCSSCPDASVSCSTAKNAYAVSGRKSPRPLCGVSWRQVLLTIILCAGIVEGLLPVAANGPCEQASAIADPFLVRSDLDGGRNDVCN